ncbi:MAG: fasciclin domain-containing protein [Acidobacteriota bacterium]
MKRLYAILFVVAGIALASSSASAQMMKENPMVGGAAMYPSKTIVANAVNSADHTTLVAAVKAAGLVDTLNSAGPFTVFAPTNAAFDQLPAGTVDTLLKPENKSMLTNVLTYHVLAGKYDSKALAKLIKKGRGKASLKTVSGGTLTAMMDGGNIVLRDAKGGTSTVTTANVYQSNGVIHVVNAVLLPN